MLIEPAETDYDLRFRLFGFPIRVHPLHWLFSVILGWPWTRLGNEFLLIWVLAVFVSILIHELGHAFAMRVFGMDARIVLYSLGGLAIPYGREPGRLRRIAISLAGPGAGFMLAGALYLSQRSAAWAGTNLQTAVTYDVMILINVWWGLVNLLPIFPLDGGRVSQEVCRSLVRGSPDRVCFGLSMATAGLISLHGFASEAGRPLLPFLPFGGLFMGLFFGVLAYQSYQLYQQAGGYYRRWD